MILVTGIIAFIIGMAVGAIVFRVFKSDAATVKKLRKQLDELRQEHDDYRQNVNSHFTTTAQLFHNLTDSYRDVYLHLATGAETLCPESISNQLSLTAQEEAMLSNSQADSGGETATGEQENAPPRDYADKTSPDQKGSLAEDYGLDKPQSGEQESHAPHERFKAHASEPEHEQASAPDQARDQSGTEGQEEEKIREAS